MTSERDLSRLLSVALQAERIPVASSVNLTDRVRARMATGGGKRPGRTATIAIVVAGMVALTTATALAASNVPVVFQILHIVKTEPVAPVPTVTTLADAQAKADFHVLTLGTLDSAQLQSVMYRSVMLPSGKEALEIDLTYRVGTQYVYVAESRDGGNPLDVKIQQLHTVSGEGPSGYGYEDFETLGGQRYLVERTTPGGPFLSIAWQTANGVSVSISVTAGLSEGLDQTTMMSLVNHLK
jgi:hypothetical protein